MAHFVFTDPYFKHDTTELSDHVLGITLEYDADEVEDTSGGDTTHVFLPGLKSYSLTVELAQDLAGSDVDATLFADVGVSRTIAVRNTTTTIGSTNPEYTATMFLKSYPPIGTVVGEKAVTRAVYTAITALTRVTS